MVLSREWLSEFTDIKATDKEYCDAMTLSGSKVEGFKVVGEEISNVVAGRIKSLERHPDSDHMWICSVDVGKSQPVIIVTGAQNLQEGDFVPAALDGATLPGGVVIRSGKLRGVESCGMLCSVKELGLTVYDFPYAIEDGIFVLSDDPELKNNLKTGDDVKTVCGLGDTVVEFEITNNRADCLSIIGLARESAATFGAELKLHTPLVKGGAGNVADYLSVEIADKNLCPRYTAKMVKNIKIAPSPKWMRQRLRDNGIRPINNIVDITNYVMLEYGQPMHAFDYACVKGNKIVVRKTSAGETLRTLDGSERALATDMLVIADEKEPIGIAGVMGGGNSEITSDTEMIVFESANFNGTSVRKTAIALGMRTDASGRFEKGLDIMNTIPAAERACELVELLGAGEVLDGTIDVMAGEHNPMRLPLEPEKINALLGTDIDRNFMVKVLEKLDFTMEGDDICVPSFRQDIEHYADIAEEIARFYGYDKIVPTVFKGAATKGGYDDKQNFEADISGFCRGMGYYEVMTYSFGSKTAWDKIYLPADSELRHAFVIQNPLGEDTSVMRTTALPSMLDVLTTNLSKRNMEVKLFELATVYLPEKNCELANERTILNLGAYGQAQNFFTLKGSVEALMDSLRINKLSFKSLSDVAAYHPGRCAAIYCGDVLLGVMGQIHPLVCEVYGMNTDVFAAELNVANMMSCRAGDPSYTPLPKYPAITRDIAVVCDNSITVAELMDTMKAAGGEYLESCKLFDIYTGAGIQTGKKSLAFSLSIRAQDQTLTYEHAEEIVHAILAKLEKVHGAVIR